ncbi:MAG: hypothetical protein ABIO70_22195 [Pseudomonadota bacterium]
MRIFTFVTAFALLIAPLCARAADPAGIFEPSDRCLACHNGMTASDGADLSVGVDWRSSMMANAARDPYWQGSVRREVLDHPLHQGAIEDKCSTCHMPMMRYAAKGAGEQGRVLVNLPDGAVLSAGEPAFAADGVSCTVCHQITVEGLGEEQSFTGGFVIDTGLRQVLGPVEVDAGRTRVMQSSSTFEPRESEHVRQAALCGSCHTLYTHAYGPDGEVTGELAEQMPYQEWLHSAYVEQRTCQDCHMPDAGEAAYSSVLPKEHPRVAQHVFRGGNFFMPRVLNAHRAALGVQAGALEQEATANSAAANLADRTAELSVAGAVADGTLELSVAVRNLAGHKLPTAYPSRRVWLHVTVRGVDDAVLFESGALRPDGSIAGNDNDADPAAYEPHYARVERPDQVQIWEPVLAGPGGAVTTGLLTATGYVKDNRLLPRGFDAATADPDIAVYGAASTDPDFGPGGDTVIYAVPVAEAGALRVEVALLYQPIGYRWAHNLGGYDALEPARWVRFYEELAHASGVTLAEAALEVSVPVEAAPE